MASTTAAGGCATVLDRVTFGITSFNRPHLVKRLLSSIGEHYPGATVAIAENGLTGWWDHPVEALDGDREVCLLPFDAGCAAARNALIDRCRTEYLLFLEEDFVVTGRTRIELLVDILDSDGEVGMAGGYVDPGGHPAALEERTTPQGKRYQLAKTVRMFAMGRRAFFADHRFDELLKTGEHGPFMTEVREAGKWRMAYCPETAVLHKEEPGGDQYKAFRGRALDFKRAWEDHRKLERYLEMDRKSKESRSMFGKQAANSFGHGDFLFLDYVLCRQPGWKNCVELGTGSGLTTLYLAISFMLREGTVHTFDKRYVRGRMFHEFFPSNVVFEESDVLEQEREDIAGLLARPGTFAFFDDGNKRREVELYARHLRPGSGFIIHDFPVEFGPEDVKAVLRMGFEEFKPRKAEMMRSCCRCFVRRDG